MAEKCECGNNTFKVVKMSDGTDTGLLGICTECEKGKDFGRVV